MTPIPISQPATGHLTDAQLNELLGATPTQSSPATAHLLACDLCAAELAGLRASLALFRDASTAYADQQTKHLPRIVAPTRRPMLVPAYWAAAAAALMLAAILPLQMLHHHTPAAIIPTASTPAAQPAESDEALLDDVNRDISASVPTPMQALDTTTNSTSASITGQNSTQRKD